MAKLALAVATLPRRTLPIAEPLVTGTAACPRGSTAERQRGRTAPVHAGRHENSECGDEANFG
jgi:hypothetical protein